jgi:5'-nucleotidase
LKLSGHFFSIFSLFSSDPVPEAPCGHPCAAVRASPQKNTTLSHIIWYIPYTGATRYAYRKAIDNIKEVWPARKRVGCRDPPVPIQPSRPDPISNFMPRLKRSDPIILVTNDDGFRSKGIIALAAALRSLGKVFVVAPDRERSGAGHSLTLTIPLRVENIGDGVYAVDGTPTDCVNLAINGILRGKRVALVASGINKGANLGDDITYSGTVSAAMEGTLLGVPSIAVSLASLNHFRFDVAAAFAARTAEKVLRDGMPEDTLLNINVPNVSADDIREVRITRQGKRIYGDAIVEKRDPRGRKYYWIGGNDLSREDVPGSDLEAVEENCISVTPLHLDMTNYSSMRFLRRWKW